MPPSNRPSFERLYECESELCIQRLVDEYIYDLINGNECGELSDYISLISYRL